MQYTRHSLAIDITSCHIFCLNCYSLMVNGHLKLVPLLITGNNKLVVMNDLLK